MGLCPDDRGGHDAPVLPYCRAEPPSRFLASGGAGEVFNPSLGACLDEAVEILAPFAPVSCHETSKVSEALEPLHQSSGLPWLA